MFVLSLGVVTGKRVRLYEAILWGVKFTEIPPSATPIPYRTISLTSKEGQDHINALMKGEGPQRANSFAKQGWCIEAAPSYNYADY